MSTGQRQPIIKQSNHCTENVYTGGGIGSSHSGPGHIMAIDLEWTKREYISLSLRFKDVSFCIPGLVLRWMCCALLSAAWKGASTVCTFGRTECNPFTRTSVTTDPTDCIHFTGNTSKSRMDTWKKMLIYASRSFTFMCARRFHKYIIQINVQTHREHLTL